MGGFNILVLFSILCNNEVLPENRSEVKPVIQQNILLFTCAVIPDKKLPILGYISERIDYNFYWKSMALYLKHNKEGMEKVNLTYKAKLYGSDCREIYRKFIDCFTSYNKTKLQFMGNISFLYIYGPFCEIPFHSRAMKPLKQKYCSVLTEDVLIVTIGYSIISKDDCRESRNDSKFDENMKSNLVYLSGTEASDAKLIWNLLVEHFGWKTFVLLGLSTTKKSDSFGGLCTRLFDEMYDMSQKDRDLLVKKFYWKSNTFTPSKKMIKNIWLSIAKITRVIVLCSDTSFLFSLLNEIEHDDDNRNKYAVIFLKVSEEDIRIIVEVLKLDKLTKSLKYLKIVVPQNTTDCEEYAGKEQNIWAPFVSNFYRHVSNQSSGNVTFRYPIHEQLDGLNFMASFGVRFGRYFCSLVHYFDLVSKLVKSNRTDINHFRLSNEFSTTYRPRQPRKRSGSDYATDLLSEMRLLTYDQNENKFVPAINLTWHVENGATKETTTIFKKIRTILWHDDDDNFKDSLYICDNKPSLFQCGKKIEDRTALIYSSIFGSLFGLLLAAGSAYLVIQLITKKSKMFLLRRYKMLSEFLTLKKTKTSCGDVILCGKYKEQNVLVVPIPTSEKRINLQSREILQDLDSIARFSKSKNDKFVEILGFISTEAQDFRLVFKVATESNLQDVLKEGKLDLELKFSLIRDLTLSLNEVHQGSLKYYGDLKTSRCIVDDRFVLRLMLVRLPGLLKFKQKSELKASEQVWYAPEMLRDIHAEPTPSSDMYSFGIIIAEIVFQRGSFYTKQLQRVKNGQAEQETSKDMNNTQNRSNSDPSPETHFESMGSIHTDPGSLCDESAADDSCGKTTVNKVTVEPIRQTTPFVQDQTKFRLLEEIIEQCWNENPDKRPKTVDVLHQLQVYMKKENIDAPFNTSRRLQQYSKKLIGQMVTIKSEAIHERDRALKYLVHMIPSHLSYELMKGAPNPAPEKHENVTIYFNDLVEFNSLMKQHEMQDSIEIIEILHEVFQAYDQIVKLYDVVPLHRVGSSLLLAAGVLHKTSMHAIEIAQPALQMRHFAKSYTRVRLNLRGGIHSGPVMSGICGRQIPQYGLFGDTVNTASRMASHAVAGEIQISESTHDLLMQSQSPKFRFTGPTQKKIKGKNLMKTYMLVGCGNYGENISLTRRLDDRPIPAGLSSTNTFSPLDEASLRTSSQKHFTLTAGETAKSEKEILAEETEFGEWDEFLNSESK